MIKLKTSAPGTPPCGALDTAPQGGLTALTAAQLAQVAGGGFILGERGVPTSRGVILTEDMPAPQGVILGE